MTAHRGPMLPPGGDLRCLPVGPFRARVARNGGALWLVLESGPWGDDGAWHHLATVPVQPWTPDELRALACALEGSA